MTSACVPGARGLCKRHGQPLAECERDAREEEVHQEPKTLLVGGIEWVIDEPGQRIVTMIGGVEYSLSLSQLVTLHDEVVRAANVRCRSCGGLETIAGGRSTCCGTL